MKTTNKLKANSFLEKLKDSHLTLERIVCAFVASFMLSYIVQMANNKVFYELESYYNSINFFGFWLVAIVGTTALCGATYFAKLRCLIPRTLLLTTTVLSFLLSTSYTSGDVYFLIGLAIVDLIVILWLSKDDKLELSTLKLSYKTCFYAAIVLFVISSVYFAYYTSLEYKNFQNATFDFGIFAQMFENMATTGKALTTVERSVEMSHFGVHFSPFFYLLLPGYMIFRSPVYLVWAQALAVAAGVFAVYLICKKLELSPKATLAFELIYTLYPCLFNGCFYDFHENKFLTTIILFLFYFILCDNRPIILLFSLMLLSVKEDAAIYLIVIALYVLISRKRYLNGSIMLALAVVYFATANKVVASMGSEGVMMWRLSDYFINGEQTYMSVLKSIVFDVGYLIKMMFTADKFPFVIWMLLPVMFTPFATKKVSSLILLLPIIPINLMQSWQYQYDINYQYTYGVAALVIFLSILGISNLKSKPRLVALLMSVMMCINLSANILTPKINNCISAKNAYSTVADDIDDMLQEIPKDASVTAGHFIMPHLYFVKELYTVPDYYKAIEQTDYFVIDTRDSTNTPEMKAVMGSDYSLIDTAGFVEVYKHN